MFRLILATISAYIVGKERKNHDKSGGSRTMAVIGMSSCLIAIISLELSKWYNLDVLRLMQGALQGIGFIGAGIVWQNKNGVEGLTTASSLFATVILGFLYGFGMYFYAILSSIILYFLLESKYWKIEGDK